MARQSSSGWRVLLLLAVVVLVSLILMRVFPGVPSSSFHNSDRIEHTVGGNDIATKPNTRSVWWNGMEIRDDVCTNGVGPCARVNKWKLIRQGAVSGWEKRGITGRRLDPSLPHGSVTSFP